ncbi:MAG: UDP-N-acetylmuramate dehydrogenase [Pyrinomonadaceae bacterium]
MAGSSNELVIQKNVPLAGFTTLGVGGDARAFVEVGTINGLNKALDFAESNNLEVFILGGGSNVVIADEGFPGLVIKLAFNEISVENRTGSEVLVTAGAGVDWDTFVEYCVSRNYAGLECLSGIPGLVGGTPIQNVGAYGHDVSETIESVFVFDISTRETQTLSNVDCEFSYRSSIFNSNKKDKFAVLAVHFALVVGDAVKIDYAELKAKFQAKSPTLQAVREAVCEIRASKGMLVRQGGTDSNSAGSFFKNPIITRVQFQKICEIAKGRGILSVPSFPGQNEEEVKVPAAWLIENSGFEKGFRHGNAGISGKHTLALINANGATAKEIMDLKKLIQNGVFEKFGIELVPEPNFIGFESG